MHDKYYTRNLSINKYVYLFCIHFKDHMSYLILWLWVFAHSPVLLNFESVGGEKIHESRRNAKSLSSNGKYSTW